MYVDPPLSVESSIIYLTTSVRQIKFKEAAAALLKNMRVVFVHFKVFREWHAMISLPASELNKTRNWLILRQ